MSPRYLLDSDVFLAAKNSYYAFELCPGFWKGIVRAHARDEVGSIDRVRGELLAGRKEEDLVQWVLNDLPDGFFEDSGSAEVSSAYAEVMLWVQRSSKFFDHAKAKFATGADGWLVAHAMVKGAIVVTNEQPRPESRSDVKLPDICVQFRVTYVNTFTMLRGLSIRFELVP